jgi:hypothetical protein
MPTRPDSEPLPVTSSPASGSRWARAARLFALFAGGQGAVQILNVIGGLLLIRFLPKEAYAQFTLGNSMLSILGGLIEFGFAPAIVALVADRIHDRALVGRYVRSACYFRDRLLMIVGPGVLIALIVLGRKQDWPYTLLVAMGIVVLAAAFFQGRNVYFTIPLRMHRRVRLIYTPHVIGTLAKIAVFFALWAVGLLTAVVALGVHLAMVIGMGRTLRRSAAMHMEPVAVSDREVNRRMLHHLAPMIPMHLFSVLQGQILVILVTILGSTTNIAEIGALGRIAQLFVFATALHSVLVIPWIARTPRERLFRRYMAAALYPVAICAAAVAFAFLFPGVLLWLLGPAYSHLRTEVGWMILAGGVHYVGASLFHLHFSRRWLYWWSSVAQVLGVLAIQVLGIVLLDLSRTQEAVFFALMTNTGILAVNLAVGVYGFWVGPRGGDPGEAPLSTP